MPEKPKKKEINAQARDHPCLTTHYLEGGRATCKKHRDIDQGQYPLTTSHAQQR